MIRLIAGVATRARNEQVVGLSDAVVEELDTEILPPGTVLFSAVEAGIGAAMTTLRDTKRDAPVRPYACPTSLFLV